MYNQSLHFHFIGIGGSGMSGIAEVLLSLGFRVSGTDLRESPEVRRLRELGATIAEGHDARNVPSDASLVVYSSAVSPENPEMLEARRRGMPAIPRAEVLGELMRLKFGIAVAGSHGKTTTTSLVATVLERAGLDPTVIIGGRIRSMASGGKLGKGDFLVAESDESDRSFLGLKPTIAIVTNIDAEHLSAYSSLDDLERSFASFAASVPFYGLAILCVDDPRVAKLAAAYPKRKSLYGLSESASIRAKNLRHSGGRTSFEVWRGEERLFESSLRVPGEHLVVNALAAVAAGLEAGVPPLIIGEALESFPGVARRLEIVGEGRGVRVVNDYGHHPTEIRATLRALRAGWGEDLRTLHVVFQPHRYTRTKECLEEFRGAFGEADALYLTDIYSAGEPPIEGVSGERLFAGIDHPKKEFIGSPSEANVRIPPRLGAGDIVVFLGAGSIGAAAWNFARELGIAIMHEDALAPL